MRRKEDPPLITGRGHLHRRHRRCPGMLYAAIVRSPEAHAKITSIDTTRRRGARPASRAVLHRRGPRDLASPLPMAWVPPGVEVNTPEHWPLAKGAVKHVGDPVAVVVGEDRYAVVDAAEDVLVEYEPLPVVVDPEAALQDGAALVHDAVRHEQDPRVVAGRRRRRAGARRVRRRRRAARSSTTARPARRSSRARVLADYRAGELTVYELDPGPALPAALPRAEPRDQRGADPRRSRPTSAAASAPSCRSTARRCSAPCARASSTGR